MISEMIKQVLSRKQFVYFASSDLSSRPNVAPKFLVKYDKDFIYLVDYVIGQTWENVKANPWAAVSFKDDESLTGYVFKGPVTLLTSGAEFNEIIDELHGKQLSLTVERVIKGIQRGKKHENFEIAAPSKGAILKVKVEEIVEVSPSGKLKREKV